MSGRAPQTAPITTDPWAAFGYIVSGVAVYGLAGWGLGHWLGASWLIPVGVLVGAVLGIYMVVARFRVGMAALDALAASNPEEPTPATPTDRPPTLQSLDSSRDRDGRQTTSRGADA